MFVSYHVSCRNSVFIIKVQIVLYQKTENFSIFSGWKLNKVLMTLAKEKWWKTLFYEVTLKLEYFKLKRRVFHVSTCGKNKNEKLSQVSRFLTKNGKWHVLCYENILFEALNLKRTWCEIWASSLCPSTCEFYVVVLVYPIKPLFSQFSNMGAALMKPNDLLFLRNYQNSNT